MYRNYIFYHINFCRRDKYIIITFINDNILQSIQFNNWKQRLQIILSRKKYLCMNNIRETFHWGKYLPKIPKIKKLLEIIYVIFGSVKLGSPKEK